MKLTLRFWLWATFTLLSFFVMQLTLRPFARYFFFFLLLLGPISLLIALWSRSRLRPVFTSSAKYIARGEKAHWTLTLFNPTLQTLRLEAQSSHLLRPRDSWQREFSEYGIHTGPLEAPKPVLTIRDPLSLLSLNLRVPAGEPIYVLPQPKMHTLPPLRPGEMQWALPIPKITPAEQPELSSARTLRPGDPMKRIHWKLSSRTQEWMVREEEDNLLARLILLLDMPASLSEDLYERDDFLDRVAGLKLSNISSEHADLHAYAPRRERARFFRSREVLEQIARIPHDDYLSPAAQLEKEPHLAGGLYILLTPRRDLKELDLSKDLFERYPLILHSLAGEVKHD